MAGLPGKEREDYVRRMFSRLAGRYDKANHWMSWGQDVKWRREVIDRAHLPKGGKLLDLGCGTGDLALEARRRDGSLLAVGADFAPAMMQVGRLRQGGGEVDWLNNNALELPFASGTFDAVVSGYLLRNISDLMRALAEQYRVMKPGGAMVCLDTTPPPQDTWHWPARFYLQYLVPVIGRLITGDDEAYHYLPASTGKFLTARQLAGCLKDTGFREVGFRRFMGATMAIHWGIK